MVQNCGAQQRFGSTCPSLHWAMAWASTSLLGDNLIHLDNKRACSLDGQFKLPLNSVMHGAFHFPGNPWSWSLRRIWAEWSGSNLRTVRIWGLSWWFVGSKVTILSINNKPETELSGRTWVNREGGDGSCFLWTTLGKGWLLKHSKWSGLGIWLHCLPALWLDLTS